MTRRPRTARSAGVVVVLLALLALVGCGGTAPPAAAPAPAEAAPTTAPSDPSGPSSPPRTPGEPVAVRLPSIGAASALLRLGIDPGGAAEVPADFDRAGWFSGGGRPGAPGPTVVLGHVDSRSGPAIFYRLRDLAPGDVVEVDLADGTTARYAVERREQVAKDRFPTFAVFGATPDDVLRLITCSGEFDRGVRSYTDNLVVHAVRV